MKIHSLKYLLEMRWVQSENVDKKKNILLSFRFGNDFQRDTSEQHMLWLGHLGTLLWPGAK